MARVLWLTEERPDRALGGGNIRSANILLELAQHHEITLVVAEGGSESAVADAVARYVEVPVAPSRPVPAGRQIFAFESAFTRAGPTEVRGARGHRAALGGALEGLEHHDITVATHLSLVPLIRTARRSPWASHLYHVPSLQLGQRASVGERFRYRVRLAGEAAQARRWERRAAAQADAIITVSDDDAAHFRSLGARKVIVSPNGVDADRFAPTPLPAGHEVLFSANMSFPPNVDAARWLALDIFPRVRERIPDARLSLVGRLPNARVRALAEHVGVEVHPDVPDVLPYLRRARVATVPLRAGTGTRLKVLEAMAAGRPLVGTSIGLEGFDLRHREHAWIADDAAGFADGIATLLEDDAHAEAITTPARRIAEGFDWRAIASRLARDLDELAYSSKAR
jgi:glycosyltransferase involved in cell wall biosynthesis